ncbi:hypothetical protein MRB53_039426 [Persea americana]|nr:hypothetical protein MRB53_039426 [Persea americana]
MFEARPHPTPTVGIGLFATRRIRRGECIIREPILLRVGPEQDGLDAYGAFEALSAVDKVDFLGIEECGGLWG